MRPGDLSTPYWKNHSNTLPLDAYFDLYPTRKPAFNPLTFNTGLGRGYVAHWEIMKGRLYLKGIDATVIDAHSEEERSYNLRELFPSEYKDGAVSATWYTGDLKLLSGRSLHEGTHAYAHVFSFVKGKLVAVHEWRINEWKDSEQSDREATQESAPSAAP